MVRLEYSGKICVKFESMIDFIQEETQKKQSVNSFNTAKYKQYIYICKRALEKIF